MLKMLMFRCLKSFASIYLYPNIKCLLVKSSPIFRFKLMNVTALKHGAVAADVGKVEQKLLNI